MDILPLDQFEYEAELYSPSAVAYQRHGISTSGRVTDMPAGVYTFGFEMHRFCEEGSGTDFHMTSQKVTVIKINR
jgi:hypothetical protein